MQTIEMIERAGCTLSGSDDLEHLHTFADFPVFMGCSTRPAADDLKADMSWWISRSTGLVQLRSLLPLDVLYPESHGSGTIGTLWQKHHDAFAAFLSEIAPSKVFEIGGAHGILEKTYQSISTIPWTILEPNPSPVQGCKANFIKGFFGEDFVYDEPFDAVVHSHLFEHVYNPDEFMAQLSSFIGEGRHLVFSLPNMQVMLERKYTNCINFEHTVLLSEPYVEYLLAKHGFRVVAKKYFLDDHSVFFAAVRDRSVEPVELRTDLYERNKRLYLEYVEYHQSLIRELNEKMRAIDTQIYLFGAHVFAQYLLAFGLDTSKIVCLIDNDRKKQGKRLYGTDLTVRSPACLEGVDRPYVILKAGVYNDEIKADILGNINSNVSFLE